MIPQQELFAKFFEVTGAISVFAAGMAWWRKDGPKEDDVVVEAANTVLDALSDADTVERIDMATGRNLHDQLTVEEAVDMHRERELRGCPRRN